MASRKTSTDAKIVVYCNENGECFTRTGVDYDKIAIAENLPSKEAIMRKLAASKNGSIEINAYGVRIVVRRV